MKTTMIYLSLFYSLVTLLWSQETPPQDFRAVPPAEQPNEAELTYFGGKNPNAIFEEQPDKKAVALVTEFLTDLTDNQLEAAHQRMAEGFVAYGPSYDDKLESNDLLNQWERNGQLFTNQNLTIETASTTLVPTGNNRGLWIYVKRVWSATNRLAERKLIGIPFHQLARVRNDRIERIYTSYGTDQLFYDRSGGSAWFSALCGWVIQRRTTPINVNGSRKTPYPVLRQFVGALRLA